jgi:hypothetical protein
VSRRKLTAKAQDDARHVRFVLEHSSLAEYIELSSDDPEWCEIEQAHDRRFIIDTMKRTKPKRGKGRPGRHNKLLILYAAAKIKAADGYYTKLAAGLKMTPKKLTDLVNRPANRPYFDRMVGKIRKAKVAP